MEQPPTGTGLSVKHAHWPEKDFGGKMILDSAGHSAQLTLEFAASVENAAGEAGYPC